MTESVPTVKNRKRLKEHRSRRMIWADWLLANRLVFLFIAHLFIFTLAYAIAYGLRFDFDVEPKFVSLFLQTLPLVVGIKLILFVALKSFHGWWRYVTFNDLVSMTRALLLASAVIVAIDHFLIYTQIPRAVLILDFMVSLALLSMARSSWRLAKEGIWPGVRVNPGCTPALMISNRHETIVLSHQINSRPNASHKIVGILSDDERSIGSRRAGIPIVGTPEEAPKIAARYGAEEIWVIAGELDGKRLREIKRLYDEASLSIKVIAPLHGENGFGNGNGNGNIPIRDIDINDLLHRDPVNLDQGLISSQLRGKCVMVTGAGGSIGSEICRQLIRFEPSGIVLVDHRENSVFLINNELQRLKKEQTTLFPAVGDVLDESRMRRLFEMHRPEYVYHAAAHKHVGLMEINPGEAVKNNVFGTKSVADLAAAYDVMKFVLISTDKAVNPTSVMGASKQIAERYVHSMAQASDTAFVVVRFGNVLGSNGSVVPIFTEQIERGGPITITDPKMKRYFMSIPEASQLVLQAASMGKGGEIFVLEMGEQVSILELARDMIRLAGLPSGSIEIDFIGKRPGEKLYEELYFDEEQMIETDHPKVHAAYHRDYLMDEVQDCIHQLGQLISASNYEIQAKLKDLIPEYQWEPKGRPLEPASFRHNDPS